VRTNDLFNALDLDADGKLSGGDLRAATKLLGWHWPEAPLYAVLHALTLRQPLPRDAFLQRLREMVEDEHGPFGRVLFATPLHAALAKRMPMGLQGGSAGAEHTARHDSTLPDTLRDLAGQETADVYKVILRRLEETDCRIAGWSEAALLVIDPQRSFTRGAWMHSIGQGAVQEVEPIRLAFERCASLLREPPAAETMFTRCPFPPESYDWDDRLSGIIDAAQLYFVKPGNSVMWPPTNGFSQWIDQLLDRGRRTLVMAGCTLNSCVRVSAVEVQRQYGNRGLQVVVDLSLCGARLGNYVRSAEYGGRSSVEAAVEEMLSAGVRVLPGSGDVGAKLGGAA
jgi:hypothetical protein